MECCELVAFPQRCRAGQREESGLLLAIRARERSTPMSGKTLAYMVLWKDVDWFAAPFRKVEKANIAYWS